jgi:hypothetical protein
MARRALHSAASACRAMTTTQFALFFAAILIAYVLVHARLVRFEKHLREIAGLKPLNERLKGVSDVLERVRLDRVEELLGQLHEDLQSLLEAHGTLERELLRAKPMAPAGEGVSAGERIRAAVEARLLALGFGDLRILSDLRDASVDGETSVQVECARHNMVSKGKVTARNGAIVAVELKPVAQTFP